jgi:small subunit ribosomal protein S1
MPDDPPKDSFAALFERTGEAAPARRGPRVGDTVEVVVAKVGKDAVFVDLDGRRQGYIDAIDLRAVDGAVSVVVGSVLRANVVETSEEGTRLVPTVEAAVAAGAGVSLGKDTEAIKVAVGQVVSGTVDRVESYGIFIQLAGTRGRTARGLAPRAELGAPRGADLRKAFPLGTKLSA